MAKRPYDPKEGPMPHLNAVVTNVLSINYALLRSKRYWAFVFVFVVIAFVIIIRNLR